MTVKVGINGFGRIGRQVFKAIEDRHGGLEVVAVNDLFAPSKIAPLLKWDTVYGRFDGDVDFTEDSILVNKAPIRVFAEREPGAIPWSDLGVQIVIESTGRFTDATKAAAHRKGTVKKVIISAPAKGEDKTIVLGVNEGAYYPSEHHVISNASCTTNGLAPVAKVLNDTFGIDKGILTTVHSYTGTQSLVDTTNNDARDARAAAENIIPSATGAARAVGLVIPSLQGRFTGLAFRVPTPTVSVIDFTAILKQSATADQIREAMCDAAAGPMRDILDVTDESLVSSDLRGNTYSSIFSAVDTLVLDEMVKVVAWYDNEWGYACRVSDLAALLVKKGL